MHWHIFAIGKPKLGFARDGVEEYAKRLRPDGRPDHRVPQARRRRRRKRRAAPPKRGHVPVVLDERGERMVAAASWRDASAQWEQERIKSVALLIGGAEGHSAELRAPCGLALVAGPADIPA